MLKNVRKTFCVIFLQDNSALVTDTFEIFLWSGHTYILLCCDGWIGYLAVLTAVAGTTSAIKAAGRKHLQLVLLTHQQQHSSSFSVHSSQTLQEQKSSSLLQWLHFLQVQSDSFSSQSSQIPQVHALIMCPHFSQILSIIFLIRWINKQSQHNTRIFYHCFCFKKVTVQKLTLVSVGGDELYLFFLASAHFESAIGFL